MTWPSRLDRVVVVGASLAGATAAWTLRNEGYRGELSVVGAEPHRPYDRPPLSKRYLAGKLDADALVLAVSSQLDEAGVDWRLGTRAAGLDLGDRAIRLEDGTSLPFDGAVLATGSSPRTLPAQPALAGLHVLRTRDQADALVADLAREPGAWRSWERGSSGWRWRARVGNAGPR